eukprot:jgi/Mesvir1/648/Mv17260-RA.1
MNIQSSCPEIVASVASSINNASPGVAHVLRVFTDSVYRRSNITVAGEAKPLEKAVFAGTSTALDLIDISCVWGETSGSAPQPRPHNHVGAVDLLPFHPIPGSAASLRDADQCARNVGARIGADLQLPVLMYGGPQAGATSSLAQVRRNKTRFFASPGPNGQAQQTAKLVEGIWPDFGPAESIGVRSGVTLCGSSPYVMSYNIVIDTAPAGDLAIGRRLAYAVRGSNPGGIPGVEAMAFLHNHSHLSRTGMEGIASASPPTASASSTAFVEVACNLHYSDRDGDVPVAVVLDMISRLAREIDGVRVIGGYNTNPSPTVLLSLMEAAKQGKGALSSKDASSMWISSQQALRPGRFDLL